jgi:hypothetical protein
MTLLALGLIGGAAARVDAEEFEYNPPGVLESADGELAGRSDDTDYVPYMRFPLEYAPAYANSQVWGVGGLHGPAGSQGTCNPANYAMPWWDNYCEQREWAMPLCPSGTGHQGQDIRPATCTASVHPAVAVEAGTITNVGSYSVFLTSDEGTLHRYLHMDMNQLFVELGSVVGRSQPMGYVSNDFGGTPTSIHLHYDITQNWPGLGNVFVPTYMALVRSYERLIAPCETIASDGGVLDDLSSCFEQHGPHRFWRFVTDEGHGNTLRWTRGFQAENPANWAEWHLSFEEAGEYRVEIHNVAGYGSSEQAPWSVFHAEGRDDLVVDVSSAEGWIELGIFPFSRGDGHAVAVFDNSGEDTNLDRRICVDALRLTRIRHDPAPDGGVASDAGDADAEVLSPRATRGCGCDAGGQPLASPFALLASILAGALLCRRGRATRP